MRATCTVVNCVRCGPLNACNRHTSGHNQTWLWTCADQDACVRHDVRRIATPVSIAIRHTSNHTYIIVRQVPCHNARLQNARAHLLQHIGRHFHPQLVDAGHSRKSCEWFSTRDVRTHPHQHHNRMPGMANINYSCRLQCTHTSLTLIAQSLMAASHTCTNEHVGRQHSRHS
jgi:hypothetical protein